MVPIIARSEDIDVLQAIIDRGGYASRRELSATDFESMQSALIRLQELWGTRSLVDLIVFAYRAGLVR